jgi:hypothetical protein
MTETQIRKKILIYINTETNHRGTLEIKKETPPVIPDTENPVEWYKVLVMGQNLEKHTVYFQINDGVLFYAIKKADKYIICHQKNLNSIF